jgi:probable HAF family extracellular repeat protein
MKPAALLRAWIETSFRGAMLCGRFLLIGAPVLCAQTYIVTDLGTLGGPSGSAANAINSSGQVVGYAFTTDNAALHATLFSGTGSNNLDLGTLGANLMPRAKRTASTIPAR